MSDQSVEEKIEEPERKKLSIQFKFEPPLETITPKKMRKNDPNPVLGKIVTTICSVIYYGRELVGVAVKAKGDNFNKDFGRKLSLMRALQFLEKENRKEVWDFYFESHKSWKEEKKKRDEEITA